MKSLNIQFNLTEKSHIEAFERIQKEADLPKSATAKMLLLKALRDAK